MKNLYNFLIILLFTCLTACNSSSDSTSSNTSGKIDKSVAKALNDLITDTDVVEKSIYFMNSDENGNIKNFSEAIFYTAGNTWGTSNNVALQPRSYENVPTYNDNFGTYVWEQDDLVLVLNSEKFDEKVFVVAKQLFEEGQSLPEVMGQSALKGLNGNAFIICFFSDDPDYTDAYAKSSSQALEQCSNGTAKKIEVIFEQSSDAESFLALPAATAAGDEPAIKAVQSLIEKAEQETTLQFAYCYEGETGIDQFTLDTESKTLSGIALDSSGNVIPNETFSGKYNLAENDSVLVNTTNDFVDFYSFIDVIEAGATLPATNDIDGLADLAAEAYLTCFASNHSDEEAPFSAQSSAAALTLCKDGAPKFPIFTSLDDALRYTAQCK